MHSTSTRSQFQATASTRYTPPGLRHVCKKDKTRRRRLLQAITDCKSLTRGARATALGLLRRSCDCAKHVFGNQEAYAKEMGISSRQMRRDVESLEKAGFIDVNRCPPEQCPATGKWSRARTNRYFFNVPPAVGTRVKRQQKPIGHTSLLEQQLTVVSKTLLKDNEPIPLRCKPNTASADAEENKKLATPRKRAKSFIQSARGFIR